jgi:enoyl-CoA hydratase/carnithine racemase
MATEVTTRVAGPVGWITLDGADRFNAIGSPTYTAIAAAVREFESDGNVRAVVIHGAGRGFSAGADISEIESFRSRDEFHRFVHGFTDALDVLERSPLPIVAAIHGAALGGGLELALACDIRVATSDSKLGLPEAKLGVLPGAGGTQRLPRLLPVGIATEMLITGTPITGERAHTLGLVNHLADADGVLETAERVTGQLVGLAPQVAGAAKSLLGRTLTMSVADGIAAEREVASDLFDSPDGREGFTAFQERRQPTFTGAQR